MSSKQAPSAHIPTSLAKQQGLSGSDTYRHVMYLDEFHRDWSAVLLNEEALKAFEDTVVVSRRHEMRADAASMRDWAARRSLGDPPPLSAVMGSYGHLMNLENLKIASGFELNLKSRLVACGFIVHTIDGRNPEYKALATRQKSHPIAISELLAIRPYHFDGNLNYLPGLTENSLNFKLLTTVASYKNALRLIDDQLNVIDYYRCLRNQIHLPYEPVAIPTVQLPGTVVDFIIDFINTEIIAWRNGLIKKHGMRCEIRNPLV